MGGTDQEFVFNIVWTGSTFRYLSVFVCSLMANSDARFRFVTNGCTADAIAEMTAFADTHDGRVVEVFEACPSMEAHGVALDAVLAARDDGDFFCLIDPDIRASGPFLAEFRAALDENDAVTSGQGVWTDDPYLPDGHRGVAGEHFFHRNGFVFGSPHMAMYRRAALDDTVSRWRIGFRNAGPDIPANAKAALVANGHDFLMFDTGKVVNILLQEDGHRLVHLEHPGLMHIGGMSHYLSPPEGTRWVKSRTASDELEPDWSRYPGMSSRFEVARFTAVMLRELSDGGAAPGVPPGLDAVLAARLERVRDAMIDMFQGASGLELQR